MGNDGSAKKDKANALSRIAARTKLAYNITRKSIRPSGKPTNLILFVTSYCGGRCPMCFVKGLNTGVQLSMEQISEVSKFFPKPMSGVALTGGDPFLRKELPQIAEMFWKNNAVEGMHIPSNGLNPEMHTRMIKDILSRVGCEVTVAISLDALGEQYDKIRGVPGNFEKTLKTYDLLAEIAATNPRLKIAVNTVITNLSYPTINELIQFVRTRMPSVWMHDFDMIRGDPHDKTVTLPPIDDLLKIRPILRENYSYYLSRMGAALKKYQLDLNLMVLARNQQTPPCTAPETYLVVDHYGNVSFCELTAPIGNINNAPLEEIWGSNAAKARREYIHNKKCYCTHGCHQPLNILYAPLRSAIPVLKEATFKETKAPNLD